MGKKYAFTTLLATEDYLYGVLGLFTSLNTVNSKYPLHVMVTDNICQSTIDVLKENNISYTVFKRQDFCYDEESQRGYFLTLNKFHIFNLLEYDKVCFIDADALVKNNIDDVFLYETPRFFIHNPPDFLSGILFCITPEKNTFAHIVEKFQYKCANDEMVLNRFYDYESCIANNSSFENSIVHKSDFGQFDDKYWKYFGLNSLDKIQTFIESEFKNDYQQCEQYFLELEQKFNFNPII